MFGWICLPDSEDLAIKAAKDIEQIPQWPDHVAGRDGARYTAYARAGGLCFRGDSFDSPEKAYRDLGFRIARHRIGGGA